MKPVTKKYVAVTTAWGILDIDGELLKEAYSTKRLARRYAARSKDIVRIALVQV